MGNKLNQKSLQENYKNEILRRHRTLRSAAAQDLTPPPTTQELIDAIGDLQDSTTVAAALRYVQLGIDMMRGANDDIIVIIDDQLGLILEEIEKLGPNLQRIQDGHDDAGDLIFDEYSKLYPEDPDQQWDDETEDWWNAVAE